MKTIGLIGGMSWESTVSYYQVINEKIKESLGGFHSAKLVLYSVDFHEIEQLQSSGEWVAAGEVLADAARALKAAGADFLVLCTNTMHKVYGAIEAAVDIPLFHIADAAAQAIKEKGISTVGLLGTRFTMEEAFYRERLRVDHGFEVLVPDQEDRDLVHRVIFEELCLGKIDAASRDAFRTIVAGLVERGAEGVILGCTEIALLLPPADSSTPLFDTAAIHARKAADLALL
ncbi:aspartate/glutamate racemase family protein [Geomonas sp. RF6]|uniref:aspartate/glutamate racemase family protein n=1 Tax=Geomonas sp. RF6 TaxID=2897342 RepID=UPI001E38C48D|nr:aspartate/glutamate racemase family protein [Geomonas sp. RF6]UFS70664.1 aspartate/glutamate racemase family protein [Geomonas sp. RF6]